jgi:hypothetical protein
MSDITIRLRCRNLPGARVGESAAVRLGIQRGKEVVEDVSADAEEATFTAPLRIGGSPEAGPPNFLGPFAHGTVNDRFLYLCWGERTANGAWEGFGRAKIRLSPVTWEAITRAQETGAEIEAVIDMTDARGAPVFASLSADRVQWTGTR